MRVRRRSVIAATAAAATMAAVIPGAALLAPATAASADVTMNWTINGDWGSGYQGSVTVKNNTGHAIDPWAVSIPYRNTISSTWDAKSTATADGYRFTGPSWSASLAPGASATFGFIGANSGGTLTPASCAVTGATCSVNGETATPSEPTPAPTPSSSATPTTAPSPSSTSSTNAADLDVKLDVSSDWGTGRNVNVTVKNTTAKSVNGWSITMPWAGSSVSTWDATSTLVNGKITFKNLSWNADIAPGASVKFGMTDNGSFAMPTTCTSSVGSCSVNGAGASTPDATPTSNPTTSPTATPTTDPSGSATPTVTPTVSPEPYTGAKKIVGYYPAWATYARNYQVTDIQASKLTHINYAFANIQNGKCVLGDSYADTDKAFAGDTWDQGALRGNFNQLNTLKAANPGLKTMISLGGWTWSSNFSSAAATDSSRKALASSCITFMKQYGFDGIDIDWEYPVSGGLNPGVPADKANYTALLQEFKTELNAQGTSDGKQYSLSIAAPAGPTTIQNLEVANVGKTVDWMNLMSYDFHGSWDPITGHNAPMSVGSADSAAGFSITDAVDSYLTRGFPASKLVLGVPFYGRGWGNVSATSNGLYQSGGDAGVGTWEKGVFDYSDIAANYAPKMTRYWDAQAQVPYLYDPSTKLWISYDDPQSMKVKMDFINANGLGGAMIWELSGDRSGELLDVVKNNL